MGHRNDDRNADGLLFFVALAHLPLAFLATIDLSSSPAKPASLRRETHPRPTSPLRRPVLPFPCRPFTSVRLLAPSPLRRRRSTHSVSSVSHVRPRGTTERSLNAPRRFVKLRSHSCEDRWLNVSRVSLHSLSSAEGRRGGCSQEVKGLGGGQGSSALFSSLLILQRHRSLLMTITFLKNALFDKARSWSFLDLL